MDTDERAGAELPGRRALGTGLRHDAIHYRVGHRGRHHADRRDRARDAVVFVFLQNWRSTLIPVLAVPVSLIGTFLGMRCSACRSIC